MPLVLSGHYHRREQHLLPGGTLSFLQGSTGASGLRGLEHEKPTPVRGLGALLRPRRPSALQAWDDITLGGLGLVSAKIERRPAQQFPERAANASHVSARAAGALLAVATTAPATSVSVSVGVARRLRAVAPGGCGNLLW